MIKFYVISSPDNGSFYVANGNAYPSKTGTEYVAPWPESKTTPVVLPTENKERTAPTYAKKNSALSYSKNISAIFYLYVISLLGGNVQSTGYYEQSNYIYYSKVYSQSHLMLLH